MGILNKVKDFFYEDVDDFDEEEVKSKKEDKKEDKINIYDIVREKNKDKVKEDKEEVKVKTRAKKSEPVVETENLFRAERKFNFPIDVDDEEDNFENTSQDIPYVQEKVTSHESHHALADVQLNHALICGSITVIFAFFPAEELDKELAGDGEGLV